MFCGSGIQCFFDHWIRDGKNPVSGSGIKFGIRDKIPDDISQSSVAIFWVKNISIFCCGSGSGDLLTLDPPIWDGKFRIWDTHPGFATLILTSAF
jgi:hypothetical protein